MTAAPVIRRSLRAFGRHSLAERIAAATTRLETMDEDGAETVVRTRYRLLVGAGYGLVDSLVLATRADVDVEVAATLLRRGCTPETAVRILT
jgi:hypothetical protein